jgi:Sec-independent protein translocase protein TatA
MALVFFGPRKLPQLSRSLGKNLAEFRRASEEFKRTWDREVTLEESSTTHQVSAENSILGSGAGQAAEPPLVAAVAPEQIVARQSLASEFDASSVPSAEESAAGQEPQHSPKNDWL